MRRIDLNGSWEMRRLGEKDWIPAIVPGSVYNDLLGAGKMGDPFYRDNEHEGMKLSEYDYEYYRRFDVEAAFLANDRIFLCCEGLDTVCEIHLNGALVHKSSNMHRVYEIDIKKHLRAGENMLSVIFRSPLKHIRMKHEAQPLVETPETVYGFAYLRKAHFMFGWDWGPKLPDMGIWRNISVCGFSCGRLEDVYVTQTHTDGRVMLDVRVRTAAWRDSEREIAVRIQAPSGEVLEKRVREKDGEVRYDRLLHKYVPGMALHAEDRFIESHLVFEIPQPEIWWPNGFGRQPLYRVEASLLDDGKELDSEAFRIGLRTLGVRCEKDVWGESFAFVVNGVPVFSMGADYIPEDSILSRCSREKTEKLIKSCIAANHNSIRVWGGAFYPEDYFYDLCDEYGLIVWQDLMFACGIYDLTEEFRGSITREIIGNMERIRHHACLGLWCGNNELEVAWVEWGWSQRFPPKFKADYIKQFEVLLPDIAREVDPGTFYWRASPSSTGSFDDPNGENFGDMHYWGVWHGKNPFTDYRKIFPRYMSEFGIQSFPSLKTVESFTLPEDRNIFTPVMESHQKNGSGNEKILYYIAETYRFPKDFSSLLYASQLIQAEGLRYGVEHWRRNRGRCMGAVYWQLNDCWPVASWASIDYYGRWKALHYASKRFFAPILASACEEGTKVTLHVSNETLGPVKGRLRWRLLDNRSRVLQESERELEAAALSSLEAERLDFDAVLDTVTKRRDSYLEYGFVIGGETVSGGTVLFIKAKHFNFEAPQLNAEIREEKEGFVLAVTSKAYARFVELDFEGLDAVFSDNYFDLSAGTVKYVMLKKEDLSRTASLEELRGALRVRSLYDIDR